MAETPSTPPQTPGRESRRWHIASWIVPTLISVIVLAVGFVALLAGLEMTALAVVIVIAWALLLLLLSISAARGAARILPAIILTICLATSLWWVVKYDRPILPPAMGGLITQSYNGSAFALDVETLVKNMGRQSGYADSWQLDLMIDGTTIQGRELYGQPLPEGAASEPPMSDQEFPPGKPVRGWLFFAFPGVSHDYAATYFTCGSPLMDKVSLRLSVRDSKTKTEYTQTSSLTEMGKESCTPAQAVAAGWLAASPKGGTPTKGRLATPAGASPSTPTPTTPIPATPKGGIVLGGIKQGDCGVVQMGGSGNTASPNCARSENYREKSMTILSQRCARRAHSKWLYARSLEARKAQNTLNK